jgi:lysophospholipase L1-like esterase
MNHVKQLLTGITISMAVVLAVPKTADAAVDSIFGRTGAVTAQQSDYDTFFTTPAEASAAAPVQSVAGRTGAVTLTAADVSNAATLNTAQSITARKTFTVDQQFSSGTADVGESVVAFGDSITAGYGLSAGQGWADLVAAAKGWTLTNTAASGTLLEDAGQMDNIYSQTPATSSSYMLLTGFNDARAFGSGSGQQTYRDALYAALAYLSIPQASKILPGTSAVTTTGTWTAASQGSYATTVNGNTLRFYLQGPTIYLVSERVSGQTGQFSLTVDDVSYGTFNCYGNSITPMLRGYAPFLIPLRGLHTGKHKVEITKTAGDYVYFNWAASPAAAQGEAGPNVWVGNCLRMNVSGYPDGAPNHSHANDVIMRSYNAIIRMAVADLTADGLSAVYVDAASRYDPDTADVQADNIHPSAAGATKIAAAFLAQMNGFVQGRHQAPPLQRPWWTPPFDGARFGGGGAMTWTVASGGVSTFAYQLSGNTLIFNFYVNGSAVAGTLAANLTITLPDGLVAAKNLLLPALVYSENGGASYAQGIVTVTAGSGTLSLYKNNLANWASTATTDTRASGSITIEVQ